MKTIASLSFAAPALTRALRWGGALLLAVTCLAAPLRAQEVAEEPPAEVETALPTITIPAKAADGSVVEIADGTYAPLNLLTETRTLTLRAANRGLVIIEGGNSERCATLPANITLDGFVLQNGKARQGGGLRGGVFLNGTISNCSAVFGGGAYEAKVVNSEVIGCSAVFGGGAYEAKVVNSEVIGCSAEFFGTALYGGSAFSCRIIGNHAADYGAGMAALFGTTAANCLLAENTTPCDTAGALASPVQNMLLYKNTATKGTVMTAEAMAQDVCGNWVEEAKVVTAEAGLFTNAAAGDYTLNLAHETVNTALKDKGDSALGGFYDLLWHATDFAGRPRILGTDIDVGPYEIADTVTVTCKVIGAGEVSASASTVQEGDTVTFTASQISGYERDFLGFYVNGELRTTEMIFSLAITNSDAIEARFQGLSATTETFETQIGNIHPTLREELLLADGAYTLNANTVLDSKLITFKGTTLGGTTLSVSGDLKNAILVNATVECTAALSNVTLHRCLVSGLTGTTGITVTSSILKTMPESLTATLANVTVYGSGSLPATVTATNCLVLDTDTSAENFDWVGQAILPKGSASIDAGTTLSLTPYDNLDIAGRPRTMGRTIDLGAHECFYVAMTVTAEGEYTSLTPEPGAHDYLAGDTLALAYTSSRTFLGWTLNGEALGTEVTSLVIPEESTQVLTASFQGFTLASGAAFPEGATAKDTITLGAGSYNWDGVSTEAKIVGTGTQSEVTITGSVTGGRFEAVTLNATLTNATLNRCLVKGGTLTNCTVANSVLEAATLSGGTYVNNTVLSGIALPSGAVNTRTVSAVQEDYTPAVTDTSVVDSGSELNDYQKTLVGDLDYYGNPRINNVRIDLGAAEYVWAPYTVTIAVVGHGLVEPRGAVEVVRGQSLTFTAKEDPKHARGTPVVTVGSQPLTETDSHYTYTPTADNTIITVTFTGLTVGASETYKTLSEAIAEAQDGETITVQAGTYLERVDVKTKKLRIVAAEADATKTIIDANHEGRAVALNEHSEIIGFTIVNGAASEGAGVRGGTVRRCIIHDNTLTYNGFGGGVYGAFAESCLIYNNGSTTQRSSGGGASNSELLNCTVAANAAEKGGGLYDCTAKNCVIALNTDLSGITSDWAGDSIEPAPDDCCTPTSGGITVEANKIFVRPETADFRLREGIACLNAAASDERLSAQDVFGTTRPYGTGTDMGAIEWNAPDYVITLSFNSRSQATMVVNEGDSTAATYSCAWDGALATARTFTVPRFKADGTTRTSIKLTWTKATGSETDRTLSGILLDGATLSGSSAAANAAGFTWQVTSENTVNVDLTFQAESLTVAPEGDLSQALTDATPGETIILSGGDYAVEIAIGEGVTLDGSGNSSLLKGATLADGATLKGVTVIGAPVVGPATGSATLLHSIVTGVTDAAGAVKQNVVVKSSLIHNNAAGLGANVTAYLSTVADTDGTALAATAKAYGCAIWRYSFLAETGAEMVDCWAGVEPGFLAPAPEGEDYHLSAHSELIDAAGSAQWPGFTEADRALTDLAGNPRNTLQGYDCGAYEYQGTTTVTDWTWFGSSASMDGDLAGAGWRQMTLGSPHALPDNVAAVWADRNGYPEATVRADAPLTLSALTIKTVNTLFTLLQGSEAGRVTVTGALMKSAASSLVLAGPLTVQGGTTLSAGTVTVAKGADIQAANVTLNGSTTFRQTGGDFTFGNFFYARDTVTFSLEGGTFKGGELSLAKGSNQAALVFAGADVTLTRIETGDESGARYGNIIQTGGTVTLTGSSSGKNAPLHISHWPGSSTYSLRGGTLYVPNGEVRLGQDGTGTLSLEGGVAKIRAVGRSAGSLVFAGGTFHALESQTLNYVSYKSGTESRLEVADGKTLTFYSTNDSENSGGLTLGAGDFVAYHTISGRNLTLSAGTRLTLSTAEGEALTDRGALNLASPYCLTLPGEGEVPVLTGTLQAAPIAVAKPLTLYTKTLVLKVKGVVTATSSAYGACYNITTEDSAEEEGTVNVFITQIANLPASAAIPVLTVDETTAWDTSAKWSTNAVPDEATPVIVRATADATLTMPTSNTLAQVTFDVAEGKTLTLANYYSDITELRLVGAGTLDLGSLGALTYTNQTAFSGTMVVSNASQELKEATIKNQHLRFAVDYALGSSAGFTLAGGIEVAAGKTLTCNSSLAGGEALVEAGATVVIGQGCTNRLNFTAASAEEITLAAGTTGTNPAYLGGNVNAQNWKITDDHGANTKGLTLTGSVTLTTPPTSGTLAAASGLSSLTLESGELTLSSAWAMPAGAVKAGAGRVTLPVGSSMAGSATFRGPVVFAEKKAFEVSGDLVFRDDSVVYLPIGASFSATGALVVAPGTRVVLTGTPTESKQVDLFTSTLAGGLSISTLTEVALALETPPEDQVVTLAPYLTAAGVYGYTLTLTTPNVWTGAGGDSNWSTAGNWSGNAVPADGAAVSFPDSPTNKTVTIDTEIAPSAIRVAGGYIFSGSGSITSKPAIAQSAGEVSWSLFPKAGSYDVASGATAIIAANSYYEGRFTGEGTVRATGALELGASSIAFQGGFEVNPGRLALRLGAATASARVKLVGGTLETKVPATVSTLTLSGESTSTLILPLSAPLTVTDTFTVVDGTVSMEVDALPQEEDTWLLMTLPEGAAETTFTLTTDTGSVTYRAGVVQRGREVYLAVYDSTQIAWAGKTEESTDKWVINTSTIEATETASKVVWFHDVDGVGEATVSLPATPTSVIVTAQTTRFTLSGTFGAVPVTVQSGASVTLAATGMTPSTFVNDGTVTVTGTLDLTGATFSGTGTFIAGTGGTIKVTAQQLAATTNLFKRGGGRLEVSGGDAAYTYPSGALSGGIVAEEAGELVKTGSGTLYLQPTAFNEPLTIQEGTVALSGTIALKARYFKFEVYERFNDTANAQNAWNWSAWHWVSSTWLGLSEVALTLSGERLAWPEGSSIIYFDGGVLDSVVLGMGNRTSFCDGQITNLLDGNTATQFRWLDNYQYASYGQGKNPRTYFVVDAGREVVFSGYDFATPTIPNQFFYKWNVSASNDLQAWHPSASDTGPTANESEIWQTIDERTLAASSSLLKANSWMTTRGYAFTNKGSGYWSELSGPVQVASGATFDLTSAVGTTHILEDSLSLTSVTGEGTLLVPSTLNLTLDTLTVDTLRLTGSTILTQPITATSATVTTLALESEVAQAYTNDGGVDFLLLTNCTALPTLSWPTEDVSQTTDDGGTWQLVLEEDKTLHLRLSGSKREIKATISGTQAWSDLQWTDPMGGTVNLEASDSVVERVVLVPEGEGANLSSMDFSQFPNLANVLLAEAGGTLTLSDTSALTNNANVLLTVPQAATLRVTSPDALAFAKNSAGNLQLNNASIRLRGAGTLLLDFENASAILPMVGNQGLFTGNITVASGTLKFPNSSSGTGPVYNRTITVTGANAKLATGTTNDATGWSYGSGKFIFRDGATFEVYKRDTYKAPMELSGATIRLMSGATDSGRGIDLYQSPSTSVLAAGGATAENPTVSTLTFAENASASDRIAYIREGNWTVNVAEHARFDIEASLGADNSDRTLIKAGAGEMVLATTVNNCLNTLINAGTLRVTGTTGTGSTIVKGGATICGTGTVRGTISFASGGLLAVDPAVVEPLTISSFAQTTSWANITLTGTPTQTFPILRATSEDFTLQTNYFLTDETFPTNDYSLVVVDNVLYAKKTIKQGDEVVEAPTSLQATVPSGTTNWSALTWTTDGTTAVAADGIDWWQVQTVSLTAAEGAVDATVALDLPLYNVQTLNLTGALTLTGSEGKRLNGCALVLADSSTAKLNGLFDAATAVSLSGNGTVTWAADHTGTLSLAAGTTLTAPAGITLSALDCTAGGTLAVDPASRYTVTAITGQATVMAPDGVLGEVSLLTVGPTVAVVNFALDASFPAGYGLAVDNGTLKAVAGSEVMAVVSGAAVWDNLTWTDTRGNAFTPTWSNIHAVTLKVTDSATLALPSLSLDSLAIDFGATEGKTLTLDGSTSQTLPALYVLGTHGGDVLCSDGTLTLSALSASAPYVGVTAAMFSTLTAEDYTFTSDALLGLYCADTGTSFSHKFLAPQRGFAIRSGTLVATKVDNYGDQTNNTKIRVDTGATLDAHGYPVSCVLTLNGGTLKNSTSGDNGTSKRQFYSISLTADSTVDATQSLHSIAHGYNEQVIALNGYTLTKTGAGEFSIASATLQGPGTIAVNAGTFTLWNGENKGSAIEGNVTLSVAEGATLALRDTRTLKSGSCLTLSGDIEVAGTLAGDGALTVASGSVSLSGLTTYTGLTTVQNGATFSAASLVGSLTCEAGATLKPRAIDTPLSLGGTLTANNLSIDLSAFDEQPETIPLFTSPNELTTAMVATAGRYKPAVEQMEDGTWKLSYIYRFDGNAELTWAGGETGDLADATWCAEGVNGLSLRITNGMIFPANGTYTLTNNSAALTWPRGIVTVGANASLTLSSTVENSGLCGAVTLEDGATLTLMDAFAAYAGIRGNGATLVIDASMLSVPTEISVGTLKLTGSTLPTGTPRETFSCSTLVFSEELVAAIEAATTQQGTVLTLASGYTDSVVPACTTLPTGYALQKTEDGALVVAFTAPVVTELYAQVPSEGTWTGLTWCSNAECTTQPEAIAWGAVTTVTLTNTAGVPVALTLPGNLTALTTLTIGSASEAITLSGATLPSLATLTLNAPLTLDGAVISTIPATLSGTGELTLVNGGAMTSTQANYADFKGRWVLEDGTTLSLESTSENGSYFLNYDSSVAGSGQLEVRTGATLQIKQTNAFGWDGTGKATTLTDGRTVLVVDGGTVAFTGTGNQVIRRPITLKNGARLVNDTCTKLAFTRGCHIDVEGEVTIEGSVAYGLQYGGQDNGGIAPTFNLAEGSIVNFNGELKSLTATAESPSATTFELTGSGTFRFNGANTYYEATTVGAGVTLGGTGSVLNSAVTFVEGSKLLAEGGSSVLTLNGATGTAQVVLGAAVAESAFPMAVLKTAETATVTLTPPADYQITSATADGVTTHTLDLIRYTALTATVDGTKAWDELPWQTPNGDPIVSPRWEWVTALTLNVTADEALLTLPGNFSSITSLTLPGSGALTLSGGALPALTTLSLEGSLTLDGAVITTIPANLSGTGTLTLKNAGEVTSSAAGGESTFAYNGFTGRWIVETGTTLNLAGGGGQVGQLAKSDVEGSGQIVVKTGATVNLSANHVFGWKDIDAQCDRTVLVVDGGALVNNAEQYLRRTFELKNGATLSDPNGKFWLARASRLLISEGTATILNSGSGPKFGCDGATSGSSSTSAPSRIEVLEGATLTVEASLSNQNTSYASVALSGAGKILFNGANTYTQATSVAAGTTLGGTGSITASAVTLNGSKILANADGNALTLSNVSGSATFVVPENFPETKTAVLKTNSASAPTLTPPTGYVMSEETADSVKTVSLEWMPYDSLTAEVSGTVALSALTWKTPEGTAVASPEWRFVTSVTFKGTSADATVTMDSDLAATVTTLTGAGQTVTLAGDTPWAAGTRTFAGNLALSRALVSGTLSVATGAKLTLSADNSAFTGTLALAAGSTLRATTPEAIAFATSTSGDYTGLVLDNSALKLTGAGTVELAFSDASNTFNLLKSGTSYFSGGFLVTSGTLKLPGGGAADGPMKNRTITVRGANAKLATGSTKDATGWNVGTNQKLILEEGGSYELSKRDTFKTPLEMTGGIVRLMYHTGVDGNCALQIFNGQQTTVKAATGATSASPTISKLTLEDSSNSGDWRKAKITNADWQVTVEENAQFYIDAILSGDQGFVKSGAGEMVLAAENVYTGVTTVNAGTLRVTGSTGTGATTIKQNAVLCGSGTVKGTLTFEEGAIFAAAPAAPLTVNGAVTAAGTVTVRLSAEPTETVALLTAASLPAVSAFSAETLPEGFALVVVGNTLYAEKQTAPTQVQAPVDGDAAWESLSWQTMAGTALSGTIDWATLEAVTLHIADNATLSGVPALKADGQLVLDFTAATEKTLTLDASAARTLPAVTISGTAGGNLLADSATFTLTSLAAASGCPYLGTSPELLGTLTASTITFSENALIGLVCSAEGSSLPSGKTLKAPQQGFAIRSGTFKPVQGETFGDNSANTKIRVDAGAALDVNGYATTCVLTLNGGTLTNTGSGVGSTSRQLANITLTADSVIENSVEIHSIDHYYAVQTLTLNGHTLTKRGSATFGFHNASIASDGGRIVVEGGTLQFYDNDTKPNSISGAVTFENKRGTLTLSDAYTVAADSTLTFKGNVTVTGVLTVGSNTGVTIAYDGDVVPTSGLASLDTCAQVTFTETFWKAIETKTAATGTVFTLATSYGSDAVPTFETKTGYALEAQVTSAADAETTTYALVLTYSGAISEVTAVQATVSGDANWSALEWKDMSGNAVTPTWGKVTSVTLTAEAEATVTVDLPIATVTALTVTGTRPLTLVAGTTAGFPTGTLTLTDADLTVRNLYAPAAAVTVSGTGSLTWELTRGIAHTGAITTPSTVDFKTQGDMTLSSSSNTFNGPLTVLSGTQSIASADRGIKGNVTVEAGATLKTTSNDAINYDATSIQTITINGTVIVGAKWTLFAKNKLVLGANARIETTMTNLALDCFQENVPIEVTGPGAVIDAKMGNHSGAGTVTHSATVTFSDGATLELKQPITTGSGTFSLTTALADAASEGTLILTGAQSGTGTLTVGNGVLLAGAGSWGDAVTFTDGAKLLVDPAAEAPLTLNGAITGTAQVVLASAPTAPSTAALQTTAESGTLSMTNFTAPAGDYTLTLSEDSKTLYVATAKNVYTSLTATVDGTVTTWSQLPWKDKNDLDATDINWAFVEEVTLTLSANVTLTVDVALPKLAALNAWAAYDVQLVKGSTLSAAPFSALATITTSANLDFANGTVAKAPASLLPYAVTVSFADNLADTVQGAVTIGDGLYANGTVAFDGANTFSAPVTVKKGATLAGKGSLAAAVTFEAGSAVLADGAALTVGTVTVAADATVTVTPAAGLADATVLIAANALTASNFTEPTGYTRTVEGTTLKLSRNITLEVTYEDTALETVLSSEVKEQIRKQVCAAAGTEVSGTVATKIEVLHADGTTAKAVETSALEGLLTCFVNHTEATVEGSTATVKICYDFGVSHITVDADRAVIVTAKVEGAGAQVDFAEGVTFSVVDENTGKVWSMAEGDLLEQSAGEVRFRIPANRLDDSNIDKLLEDFLGTRALRVKVAR
ncbi:MAG: autotransporter-associated beta strand repeat-containing protein [Candidatus Spyradenecus sp.]